MKTNTIVGGENITGNIGSCSVVATKTQVDNSFFTERYLSIAVNSCTGKTVSQSEYQTYEGVWMIIPIVLVVLFIGFLVALDN